MIIRNIRNELRTYLKKRIDVISRRNGKLSDEDITNHYLNIANAFIRVKNGETIYNYKDKELSSVIDEFGRIKPLIETINTSSDGYLGSLVKTTVKVSCSNKEQLTYLFNNFQEIGTEIEVGIGWGDIIDYVVPEDILSIEANKVMQESIEKNIIDNVKVIEYKNTSSENYLYRGAISNFSHNTSDNGKLSATISIVTLDKAIIDLEKDFFYGKINIELIISKLRNKNNFKPIMDSKGIESTFYRLIDFVNEINVAMKDNFTISIFDIIKTNNGEVISDAVFPYYRNDMFPFISMNPSYIWFLDDMNKNIIKSSKDDFPKLHKDNNKGLVKNILISESLIRKSYQDKKTLREIIQYILDIINDSTNNLINLEINNISKDLYNISNNVVETIEVNNEMKLSFNSSQSIISSLNFSSKIDDIQKAMYVSELFGIEKEDIARARNGISSLEYFFDIDKRYDRKENYLIYSLLGFMNNELIDELYKQTETDNVKFVSKKNGFVYDTSEKAREKDLFSYKDFLTNNPIWSNKEENINKNGKFYQISILDYLASVFDIFKNYDNFLQLKFSEDKTKVFVSEKELLSRKIRKYYNIDVSISIDGVNGFRYGDVISIDYFDKLFAKDGIKSLFMVKKISHNISRELWETNLDLLFIPMIT